MNKESFLKELQSGLAVLAESEQQDILAEYAQHIDMRMASGLTEEEAIRDFGDIRQLTAEILAAYHVNPSYGRGLPRRKLPHLPDPRPALARTGGFFRRLGHTIAGALARAGRAVAAAPRRFAAWVKGLFARRNPAPVEPISEESEDPSMNMTAEIPAPAGRTGQRRTSPRRLLRQLGRGIARLCRLAAWLLWNAALLLCALPFVGLGLLALLCFGVLAVWLTQGLPLAGAVLGCVGILASCVGVLGLGSGLIWHRRRPAPAPKQDAEAVPPQLLATVREELEREVMADETRG